MFFFEEVECLGIQDMVSKQRDEGARRSGHSRAGVSSSSLVAYVFATILFYGCRLKMERLMYSFFIHCCWEW